MDFDKIEKDTDKFVRQQANYKGTWWKILAVLATAAVVGGVVGYVFAVI